jgi:rSAM/selenodomain-associated transferase 2
MAELSMVIPVLDDAAALQRLLAELQPAVANDLIEIIVADGGSQDGSPALARLAGCAVVSVKPGRGHQLAAGAARAGTDWLWFVHADTTEVLPALDWLMRHRNRPAWGRFDVRLQPDGPTLRLVAALMNQRSRLTAICTGDQGIFVHRTLLERCGGVPLQPLMEDIELSRRLKGLARPRCPTVVLVTSSRRWRERGALRTILNMWWLRLRYWLGADPERLARAYYR